MVEGNSDACNSIGFSEESQKLNAEINFWLDLFILHGRQLNQQRLKDVYKVLQIGQQQIWDQNPSLLILRPVFPFSSTVAPKLSFLIICGSG